MFRDGHRRIMPDSGFDRVLAIDGSNSDIPLTRPPKRRARRQFKSPVLTPAKEVLPWQPPSPEELSCLEGLVVCEKCSAMTREEDLDEHDRIFHGPIPASRITYSPIPTQRVWDLALGARPKTPSQQLRWKESTAVRITDSELSCPYCGRGATTSRRLAAHIASGCAFAPCPADFQVARQKLLILKKQKRRLPATMCSKCGLEFRTSELRQQHERKHVTGNGC
jgi:hypothetical protein